MIDDQFSKFSFFIKISWKKNFPSIGVELTQCYTIFLLKAPFATQVTLSTLSAQGPNLDDPNTGKNKN